MNDVNLLNRLIISSIVSARDNSPFICICVFHIVIAQAREPSIRVNGICNGPFKKYVTRQGEELAKEMPKYDLGGRGSKVKE